MTKNESLLFGMYPDQVGNPDFDPPEFLELYNVDDEPVDVSDLYLANAGGRIAGAFSCDGAIDLAKRFDIPDGTIIPSQETWLFLFVDENSADPVLDAELSSRTTLVRTDLESESGGLRVTGLHGMILLVAGDDDGNCVLDARCWSTDPNISRNRCGKSPIQEEGECCKVPIEEADECCKVPFPDRSLGWRPDRDPRLIRDRDASYDGDLEPTPGRPNCPYTPPLLVDATAPPEPPACVNGSFVSTVIVYMSPHEFVRHANPSDALNVQVITEPEVAVAVAVPRFATVLNPSFPIPDRCQFPVQFQIVFSELGRAPEVEYLIRVTDSSGGTVVTESVSFVNCNGSTETDFVRGDVNNDTRVNLSDMISIFRELFSGSVGGTNCEDAFDVDDDGELTVMDGFRLGDFLFLFGPKPEPPFPNAGPDPTADSLECRR